MLTTKAIKSSVPINQSNASATIANIQNVLHYLGVCKENTVVLGSILKKPTPSNDIDIAINQAVIPCDLLENLQKVCPEVKFLKSLNIISAAFPIMSLDGLQNNQLVQVDLMMVKDLKMAEWFYFSPSHLQSKYKGLYRTVLLSVVASFTERKETQFFMEDPVTWKRYFLKADGLFYGTQTILSLATGLPTVKRRMLQSCLISTEPNEIIRIILGPNACYHDVESFERLLTFIRSEKFQYKQNTKKIVQRSKDIFTEGKYSIPKELL